MVEANVKLKNETGLHARPAGIFVKKASQYQSDIKITAADTTVNAKSIMNILGLGLEKNTEFKIIAEGSDESEALAALIQLIDSEFEG